MAHKHCCFLLDTRQLVLADPQLDIIVSPDKMFHNSIDIVFRPWADVFLNEKTYWHTHETLLMRDGRVVQLVEEEDWLERNNESHMWRDDDDAAAAVMTSISETEGDRWLEKIMLHAMRCAADACFDSFKSIQEFSRQQLSSMDVNQIADFFVNILPNFISTLYGEEQGESDNDPTTCRLDLVSIYEAYRKSVFPPFSSAFLKPPRCRCFDLRRDTRQEPDKSNIAVLLTYIGVPDRKV